MKNFKLCILVLVFVLAPKICVAGVVLHSWQCQYSEDGSIKNEWTKSLTGRECLKGKDAGYVFYRAKILASFDNKIKDNSVSVFLNTIGEADEAYVNYKLIGKTGGFPPTYLNSMHRPRMYYLGSREELNGREFLLKVYSDFPVNRGLNISKVKIGTHSEISKILFWEDFKTTTSLPLILTLFLITTFFTLFIYVQKSHRPIHLWAALTSLFMASYTFFLSRYGYELSISNLMNYKMLVSSAMLVTICLSAFSYSLSKTKVSSMLFVLGVGNLCYLLYIQSFNLISQFRTAYMNWFFLFLIIVIVMVVHFYYLARQNSRAKFLMFGTLLFLVTALNDMSITLGIREGVNIAHFGLASFAIVFLFSEIYELFYEIKKSALLYAESVTRKTVDQAILEINTQVAHDIRSPLAALDVIIGSVDQLPEEKRIIIRSAVGRIRDIANNLLDKSKESLLSVSDSSSKVSIELIAPIIDSIVSEKRTQFREYSLVDISIDLNKSYGIFAKVNVSELKRIISNLINNAFEAAEPNKLLLIVVKVECIDDNSFCIVIEDNGKGIPSHILAKLGERGVSEGKDNLSPGSGSGLGVYHAKKIIESFNGHLIIESENTPGEKRGSIFTIKLPRSETPDWFVKELVMVSDKAIVSLDDDISIHQIWSDRLASLQVKNEKKLKHNIFSSGDEFLTAAPDLINFANFFLIDLELLRQKRTGLDVIEELNSTHPEILAKTILVTSLYEDSFVRERCARLGIGIIPKGMAGLVPMKIHEVRSIDAVLLDDDELVRMTWSIQAKRKGKNLEIYKHADELLRDLSQFEKSTPFYVDSNLGKDSDGNEVKGEIILEALHKRGYTELFLCTGYEPENFSHLFFIKKVFSKNPQI